MATITAALRVFANTELTERILSQGLRSAELFAVKTVNRRMLEIITNSTPLRKQIFLLHTHDGADATMRTSLNPSLVQLCKRFPKYIRLAYHKGVGIGAGWVFKITVGHSTSCAAELVDASRALLQSLTIKSTGLAATLIASAPLRLTGKIDFWCERDHPLNKIVYEFELNPCTTLEGLISTFAIELDELVRERTNILASKIQAFELRLEASRATLKAVNARQRIRRQYLVPIYATLEESLSLDAE
nr:hypothetical protein B0A51_00391 [Rachicladosporium sp. CCFEE 5018]